MISYHRFDSSRKICLHIMPYHLYIIINHPAIVKTVASINVMPQLRRGGDACNQCVTLVYDRLNGSIDKFTDSCAPRMPGNIARNWRSGKQGGINFDNYFFNIFRCCPIVQRWLVRIIWKKHRKNPLRERCNTRPSFRVIE